MKKKNIIFFNFYFFPRASMIQKKKKKCLNYKMLKVMAIGIKPVMITGNITLNAGLI